jgi:hypothetical protein
MYNKENKKGLKRMKLSEIMEKGRHGEVYESEWGSAKIEVYIGKDKNKQLLWFMAPPFVSAGVSERVSLENGIIEAIWELTEERGEFYDQVHCVVGEGWFYIDKHIKKQLKEEVNKTIHLMRKLGFIVEFEKPRYRDDDVEDIWIKIKDVEEKNIFLMGFDISRKTKQLVGTNFLIQKGGEGHIKKEVAKKIQRSYFFSDGKETSFLDPITFLQIQKTRLIFQKNGGK